MQKSLVVATVLSLLLMTMAPVRLGIPAASATARIDDRGFDSIAPNYDYHATGFNPQRDITEENVKSLELKWLFPWPEAEAIEGIIPRTGSIAQPLIVDGIVYGRTEDLKLFAINAKTGNLVWEFQAPNYLLNIERVKQTLPVNLGFPPSLSSHAHSFSYFDGRIYAPWPNCQVYGIDSRTGALEYQLEVPTCAQLEGNLGLFKGLQSVGPVFDGKRRVLIYGTGGRESVEGGRGAFRGYGLDDGKLLWTFYLMPAQDVGDPEWTLRVAERGWIQGIKASTLPREVLLEDWGRCPEKCGFGKGDVGIGWGQWAVDEETGMAYLGTANPSPSWNATYRPGPNVFSSSVIALRTQTGELLWWHQIVAHDLGDLDCSWNTALATINGRKIIFKQCKGALLYALDAENGEALWRTDYSPHMKRGSSGPKPNYENLLDPRDVEQMRRPWVSYPNNEPNWRKQSGGSEGDVAVAYGKVYSTTYHHWLLQRITPVEPSMRDSWGREVLPADAPESNATVWAHDASTGRLLWKYDMDEVGVRGGVTVSGNLVWFTTTDGTIRALSAEAGELVWERYQGSQSPVQPVLGADSDGEMKLFTLVGAGGVTGRSQPSPGALLAYGVAEQLPERIVEVEKEVIREVEVVKEVEVPVIKEVLREVPVEVESLGPVSLVAIGIATILGVIAGVIVSKRRS